MKRNRKIRFIMRREGLMVVRIGKKLEWMKWRLVIIYAYMKFSANKEIKINKKAL